MKRRYILIFTVFLTAGIAACKKQKFADYYADPATVNAATVEKQFAGALGSTLDFTMYKYWNYFVILQNTALHYTQVVGWQNFERQYEPGAAAVGDRWGWYYGYLSQYKEFLKVYNAAPETEQSEKRIYKIAADIFFYDQTQKVVDLHGAIPWSEAGLLSANNGDYQNSYASYDSAEDIYTKMLDDLKAYADELNSISVSAGVAGVFKIQDFINKGSIDLWKKYCNSLRIRMLMRVSGVAAFQARAASEIGSIVGNPSNYPVCTTNSDNILIKVNTLTSSVSSDLYNGIIGWGNNDRANKGMIDTMSHNNDPRLRALFQPGALSAPNYVGLDPMLDPGTQNAILAKDTIARYNFTTISKNRMLPGIVITAAETQFLLAEYYLKMANNDAKAKAAYESGINSSIDYFFWLPTISDNSQTPVTPVTGGEKTAYLASNISWAGASTTARKMELIAIQKWINYNVLQPLEGWAELRRTNLPVLSFRQDNASTIAPLPPSRWIYPDNERIYNTENYNAVKSTDDLNSKLFWDN